MKTSKTHEVKIKTDVFEAHESKPSLKRSNKKFTYIKRDGKKRPKKKYQELQRANQDTLSAHKAKLFLKVPKIKINE